jgi:hypothetical protein
MQGKRNPYGHQDVQKNEWLHPGSNWDLSRVRIANFPMEPVDIHKFGVYLIAFFLVLKLSVLHVLFNLKVEL